MYVVEEVRFPVAKEPLVAFPPPLQLFDPLNPVQEVALADVQVRVAAVL